MKKIFNIALLLITSLTLASCGGKQTLLFLNWGEYIDEDLIEQFEKEYNCTVQMDLGDSNEVFYSKVKSGTTVYDVVCPSDYMVEKMYNANLLLELDSSKLDYNPNSSNIKKSVKNIISTMKENTDDSIENYFVPYLSGTWGIMYTTKKEGLKDAILNNSNQWASLFDRTSLPEGTKVAMYESNNHAYYAACRYLGYNTLEELPTSNLKVIENFVRNMKYDAWGTDSIKKDIVRGNLDVGFMWTGDFLYYYAEQAAKTVVEAAKNGLSKDNVTLMLDTMIKNSTSYSLNGTSYSIGFDLFIPDDTIAFCDSLVIPKDSVHTDLAYKFINFMTSSSLTTKDGEELTPAFDNTNYVCYDSPYIDTYESMVNLQNEEVFTEDDINQAKTASSVDSTSLYEKAYNYTVGAAFEKYYPKDEVKGTILGAFGRHYVNEIGNSINNARV